MGHLVAIIKPKGKTNPRYGSFESVCKGRFLLNRSKDSQVAFALIVV